MTLQQQPEHTLSLPAAAMLIRRRRRYGFSDHTRAKRTHADVIDFV